MEPVGVAIMTSTETQRSQGNSERLKHADLSTKNFFDDAATFGDAQGAADVALILVPRVDAQGTVECDEQVRHCYRAESNLGAQTIGSADDLAAAHTGARHGQVEGLRKMIAARIDIDSRRAP